VALHQRQRAVAQRRPCHLVDEALLRSGQFGRRRSRQGAVQKST
jgi:hypothetical protein